MARLLLLIPTTSYRVSDFLKAAGGLDVEVTVGSNRRQVLEKYSHGQTVTLNFRNPERGTKQILDYARQRPLRAIVAVDDETTVLAAKASKALGLSHNSPESIEAAANKFRFRTVLTEAGLPSPGFTLVSLDDDPAEVANRVDFPCVLKPLALSASRGVIRANDPAAFAAAFYRIAKILKLPDAASLADLHDYVLVEDYIPGTEVALEGLLDRGRLNVLALFDKPDPLEGPYFEETLYVTPSRLSATVQDTVAAMTARAVTALGLHDGPVHVELRINENGPVIIELAARSIGGLCSRVLRFGVGISLEELILRHALGLPIDSLDREVLPSGVMMIPIPRAGRLRQVRGLEHARSIPGIEDLTITIPPGQEVIPLPEGSKYLGFIFARGRTPQNVEDALRDAHSRLEFMIEA